MGKEARVLLAERQSVIQNILLEELKKSKQIKIVDTIETKLSLLHFLNNSNPLPDILLLDASLDVEENFTITQHISTKFPTIKIIATIDAMDTLYLRKMIEAGIQGFILKESDIKTITKAIDTVRLGKKFYADSIINPRGKNESKQKIEDLTEDEILNSIEREVLKMIVNQFSVKEISSELELQTNEVNKTIDLISKKTKSNSAVSLQKYALNHKIY
ncbi:MAG: response regulator [Chitinophagales bacterium]